MAKKNAYKRKSRRKSVKKRKKSRKKRQKDHCPYNQLKPILKIRPNQCKGKLTPKGMVTFENPQIHQFNSLFCVIAKYKPVAWILFTDGMIEKYRKQANLINKIIDIGNECGIYAIINSYDNVRYFVAFYKKNLQKALLVLYLSTTYRGMKLKTHYSMGKLLGYTDTNIKAFYKKIGRPHEYLRDKKINRKLLKIIKKHADYDNFVIIQKGKIMKIPNISS